MRRDASILLLVIMASSFFISKAVNAANSDIVINEIGAYPTSTHEWIEIYNKGNDAVDITGWKFWENATNHGLTATGTNDSIVAPGEYVTIAQNAAVFMTDHPNFPGSIFASSWSTLNEAGEEIGLKDAAGNFIEQFTYLPAPDHSLERKNPHVRDYATTNWQEHVNGNTLGLVNSNFGDPSSPLPSSGITSATPSPAAHNPAGSVNASIWAQIKINEFVADPGNGNEWIELYNPTETTLDLSDGTLCDSRLNSACTIANLSGGLAAKSWVVITLTSDHLNNGGDTVILKNPNGIVVDQVTYGNLLISKVGQALARKVDGMDNNDTGDWAVTTQPTAGSANVIISPPSPPSVSATNRDSSASNHPRHTASQTASSTENITTPNTSDPVKIIWKIMAPKSATPGEVLDFSAAESADPRGGRLNFRWDFGNNEIHTGAETSRIFATSGAYTITLSASSTAGTVGQKKLSLTIAPGLSFDNRGVVLSEVFPNPSGPDTSEFIELYNTASSTADVSGWQLKLKSDKAFTLPDHTTLPPHDTLVFYRLVTHLALDNNGSMVELISAQNATVDMIEYPKSINGQSYTRTEKRWAWTTPSPGHIKTQYIESLEPKILGEHIDAASKIIPSAVHEYVGSTITDIRSLAKGAYVKLTGLVTAIPGTFSKHYFYITDGSSGIQIYAAKKIFPELAIGDQVAIAGTVSNLHGVPRINIKQADTVDILATNGQFAPEPLTLDELDDTNAGGLVVITGEITKLTKNLMYVDDGRGEIPLYFKSGTHIDKQVFSIGDQVKVTGILEHPQSGPQLWPRNQSDIEIISSTTINQAPSSPTTAKTYGFITAGGLALITLAWIIKEAYS